MASKKRPVSNTASFEPCKQTRKRRIADDEDEAALPALPAPFAPVVNVAPRVAALPAAHEPDPDEPEFEGACNVCGGSHCYCANCGASYCVICEATGCAA